MIRINKILKVKIIIVVILSIVLGCVMPAFAVELQDNKIRVGCFPLNGFYNISNGKVDGGYGADYSEKVFEYAGVPYEYVVYSSWVEALDALSRNEIDMLAPSQHTPERDELFDFDAFPIGTEYGALLTLSTNDSLTYEDFSSFNGLNVGVVPSLVFLDDFIEYEERNNFEVNLIYYKDTDALIAAMNVGDVDAALVNMMVKTDAMKLLARFGASPIYYMFSSESGSLCANINLAIDRLTSEYPELQSTLSATYFSEFNNLPFTKEELDYIASCGTLNVAFQSGVPPFSYLDGESGEITGVSCAFVEKMAELSGLKLSLQPISPDVDEQAFIAENSIVAISCVETNMSKNPNDGYYTQSYLTINQYFIGKSNRGFDKKEVSKIACLNPSQSQLDSWKADYPNFEFMEYDSIEACISAVHSGKADFLLNNRYSMESYLSAPQNKDLKIFPDETIDAFGCFRITLSGDDGRLLTSILNKAIRDIPERDKEKLISDFTEKNAYQYTVSDFVYQYRFQIIIVALILIAAMVTFASITNSKKKVRLAIEDDEKKLRNITNNIKGGVVVLKANEGLNIIYANNGFLKLIGCDREQLEEKGSYLAYVHPDDLGKIQEVIDIAEPEFSFNLRVLKTDGSYVSTLFNCTTGAGKNGNKELYCVILDLTEQDKLTEQLQIDKRRTELILNCVDEVFYEVNLQNQMVSTSVSFYEKFGWTLPSKLPEQRENYIIATWQTDSENLNKIILSTREMLTKKEPVSVIVKLKSNKEKRSIWCEIMQHPVIASDGAVASVIGLIRDVDNQITEREQLIEQAQRDPLTGLYNKESFEIMVSETLAVMSEKNNVMIFIDLDHFKNLNDTLGHMEGDKAICEAADKLRIIFSNYDIVARFGGDEFCIFVKDIPEETIRRKLDWMIEKLHSEYCGMKGKVEITCSCGVSCTNSQEVGYNTLIKQADQALYQAKEKGRNRYVFFKEI